LGSVPIALLAVIAVDLGTCFRHSPSSEPNPNDDDLAALEDIKASVRGGGEQPLTVSRAMAQPADLLEVAAMLAHIELVSDVEFLR
jgi:hypothetical protein